MSNGQNSVDQKVKVRYTWEAEVTADEADADVVGQVLNGAFARVAGSVAESVQENADVQLEAVHAGVSVLSPEASVLGEGEVARWAVKQIANGAIDKGNLAQVIAMLALADPHQIREGLARNADALPWQIFDKGDPFAGAEKVRHAGEPAQAQSEIAYALAVDLDAGMRGAFEEGPYPSFDPEWLRGDRLVFVLDPKSGETRIAWDEMGKYADCMSLEFTEMLAVELGGKGDLESEHDQYMLNAVLAHANWHFNFDRGEWAWKPASLRKEQVEKYPLRAHGAMSVKPDHPAPAAEVPKPEPVASPPAQSRMSRAQRYGT